jgi:hypothetical protein
MRAKDFMTREQITIMADRTVYESAISPIEPRTGGLPVANDKNQLISMAKDFDMGARHPMAWATSRWHIDGVSTTIQGGMLTRKGQ